MKYSHWMSAAVVALVASAPAAWAAPADKSPLSWVPATAPVVLHANSIETLRDHVLAFVKNAVPDRADMVQEQLDAVLKNGIQGRKLRGLSKDGPIFVVVDELSGAAAQRIAVIAAVSDYAEFRDNILTEEEKKNLTPGDGCESTKVGPETVYFVDIKDHVVVTPSKDVAASYVKGGTAGLDGKMNKTEAARFLAGDFSEYVNLEAVNEKFGDQIKAARKQVDDALDKAAETVGKDQKAQVEMARKMIDPIFQAVQDGKVYLASAEVRPDGVVFHADVEMRSGTATADALKGYTTGSFKEIGKLPPGQLVYAGMKLDPPLLKFFSEVMTGLSSDPKAQGMAEAFAEWVKAGPTMNVSSFSYPVSALSFTKCADPEKGLDAAVKVLQTMGAGGFPNVALKEKPEIKPNAEKYGDVSFTSVHMVWDFDKMLSGAGTLPDAAKKQMVEAMKKLIGEEVNAWIGTGKEGLIQVTAKDWESAKKALDQFHKGGGVGDDKGFAAALKELPEKSTFLGVIDAVQLVGDVLDFVKPILQGSGATLPPNFPTAVKGKPGYIGFAVTLKPDGGAVDFVVTAEAVKQVYEGYVVPLLPKK